jgi:hypothetical protein
MKPLTGQTLLKDWGLDYFKSASILGALSDEALSFVLHRGRALELDSEHPGPATL